MMISIRPYQQRAIDRLYGWWTSHEPNQIPLLVLPTGAGKSIVIAELVRLLWDTWPEQNPRTVVLVPSKELAEQNVDKLLRLMPTHRSLGVYSASLGRRDLHSDVIVATIGSIYKDAHRLDSIRCVLIDEAHLVNPNGQGQGRYRKFISDLSQYNELAVCGLTATPFRGDGIWLTDGEDPLFRGIACEVKISELLEAGHIAPLVRPVDVLATTINTDGISTSNGDYNLGELAERVEQYLPAVAADAARLAADRKKWLAFTPTVENARHLVELLREQGVTCELVCGETDKREREHSIAEFRAGRLRCLVTVLALATGFDVPDVDCIVWCRPTTSPVLYVQGAGRGLRPAEGKTDCLWLDYSTTTERMGPIDLIRGRKRRKKTDAAAPYALCKECGAHVRPASLMFCPECGARLREDEPEAARPASDAAILAHQMQAKVVRYEVTDVGYSRHQKPDSPDSLRVDYYSDLRRVASEWVCLWHPAGFAQAKAAAWWRKRDKNPALFVGDDGLPTHGGNILPATIIGALVAASDLRTPAAIYVNESGKWPEIIRYEWSNDDQNRTDSDARSTAASA